MYASHSQFFFILIEHFHHFYIALTFFYSFLCNFSFVLLKSSFCQPLTRKWAAETTILHRKYAFKYYKILLKYTYT